MTICSVPGIFLARKWVSDNRANTTQSDDFFARPYTIVIGLCSADTHTVSRPKVIGRPMTKAVTRIFSVGTCARPTINRFGASTTHFRLIKLITRICVVPRHTHTFQGWLVGSPIWPTNRTKSSSKANALSPRPPTAPTFTSLVVMHFPKRKPSCVAWAMTSSSTAEARKR